MFIDRVIPAAATRGMQHACACVIMVVCTPTPASTQATASAAQLPSDVIIDSAGVPRDHYFTLGTASAKVQQQYPSAVPVSSDAPPGVTVRTGVTYKAIGARALAMDICMPARSSPLHTTAPVVLLIHGGGWRSGDRSMELPMALQLAQHGYVAATVEYRLSPEARYPAAVLDIKAAVRWLRAHALDYGIDTLRVAIGGCSSGGHLAALVGVTNDAPEYEAGEYSGCSSSVQAIVDVDGPLDLTHPEESGKDTIPSRPSSAKRWLGATYADDPALWRKASPVTHLHPAMPPMLFVNSSLPRYHVGRDAAVDSLRRYDIAYEVHTIPDTPHPFWLFTPWQPIVVGHITAFLDRIFHR